LFIVLLGRKLKVWLTFLWKANCTPPLLFQTGRIACGSSHIFNFGGLRSLKGNDVLHEQNTNHETGFAKIH